MFTHLDIHKVCSFPTLGKLRLIPNIILHMPRLCINLRFCMNIFAYCVEFFHHSPRISWIIESIFLLKFIKKHYKPIHLSNFLPLMLNAWQGDQWCQYLLLHIDILMCSLKFVHSYGYLALWSSFVCSSPSIHLRTI